MTTAVEATGKTAWAEKFLPVLLFLALNACGRTTSPPAPDPGAQGGSSTSGASSSGAPATDGGGGSPFLSQVPQGVPIYTRVQRLTNSQFEHAAIDILRLPATTDLKSGLVPPIAPNPTAFTNDELVLEMDEKTTLAFEEAAEKAAALATASPEALARLYAGTDAAGFVRDLGRRAFRRPVSDDELARYSGMFARGEALYGAGFANGAALVIRAMLASPSFLYRTELGPLAEPLSGYDIAAKLSFWLRDTTPSDALLDAAAAGDLDQPDALVTTARAMLEEPSASAMMRDFHGQLYWTAGYDSVSQLVMVANADVLGPEAKEASLRFFERIFERNLGVREIFTSTRGFVGPALAPLYSQDVPGKLEERELGPERIGYFMQVPPLMLGSRGAEPDTVRRGVALLLQALCAQVGSIETPPLPALSPGESNRQHLSTLTDGCGMACHKLINPLGFAFEGFDRMGKPRDTDNGQPIDASGSFPFSFGTSSFADARELMTKLADDDHVYACYGQRLAGYGLQRELVADDAPLIAALSAAGRAGTLKDIALALVQSPAFRTRQKDLP